MSTTDRHTIDPKTLKPGTKVHHPVIVAWNGSEPCASLDLGDGRCLDVGNGWTPCACEPRQLARVLIEGWTRWRP